MAESEYKDSAAIVFPVGWPEDYPEPDVKDPHVTLFFLPDVTEVDQSEVEDAIYASDPGVFIMAETGNIEWFGPDEDIPVLRVSNDLIDEIRYKMAKQLEARGIEWSKTYDFKPHITIDEMLAEYGTIPEKVWLRPVELWWRGTKVRLG